MLLEIPVNLLAVSQNMLESYDSTIALPSDGNQALPSSCEHPMPSQFSKGRHTNEIDSTLASYEREMKLLCFHSIFKTQRHRINTQQSVMNSLRNQF